MAFLKFTGAEPRTYPQYDITVNNGDIVDTTYLGGSAPDGRWVSDPGPATKTPDNTPVIPSTGPVLAKGDVVPAWAASTLYSKDQAALDPNGSVIVRRSSGTSRSSYDATELALWNTVGLTKTAADGSYVAKGDLVVNVEDYRAANVTDAATLAAAAAAVVSGSTLKWQQGRTYTITSQLTFNWGNLSDVTMDMTGATISCPSGVTGTHFFGIQGIWNSTQTTATADIAKNATTITVASASAFVVGDIVTIQSTAEVFNPDRPGQYFKGELARVSAIAGNVLSLTSPTWDSYLVASGPINVGRMQPIVNLTVVGGSVIGSGAGGTQQGMRVSSFDGLTFRGTRSTDSETIGLQAYAGYDAKFIDCKALRSNKTGLGYGLRVQGVDGATFLNCKGRKNRHSIDTDNAGSLPNRNVYIALNICEDDSSCGISTHGATDQTIITSNILRNCGGGIISRGARTKITDNEIRGSKTNTESAETYVNGIVLGDDGAWSWGVGLAGQGLEITNNYVDITNPRWATDAVASYGIYSTSKLVGAKISGNTLIGFSSHGILSKGDGVDGAFITDNLIDCSSQVGTAGTTQAHGINLTPAHAVTGNVNKHLRIRDNRIINPLYSAICVAGDTTGASRSDDIDIEDNVLSGYGKYGVDLGNGYYDKNIRIVLNKAPDGTAANFTNLAPAAQFTRLPKIAANDIAGNGVAPLSTGQQLGSFLRSGSWYGSAGFASGTNALATGSAYATPFFVGRTVTISNIGINVTTGGGAGALVRLGIYADVDDGVGGYPGALVVDGGTADSSAVAFISVSTSTVLQPGLYWLVAVAQVAGCTVSALQGPSQTVGYQGAGGLLGRNTYRALTVTGALPGTYNTSPDAQGTAPQVQVKIA